MKDNDLRSKILTEITYYTLLQEEKEKLLKDLIKDLNTEITDTNIVFKKQDFTTYEEEKQELTQTRKIIQVLNHLLK